MQQKFLTSPSRGLDTRLIHKHSDNGGFGQTICIGNHMISSAIWNK